MKSTLVTATALASVAALGGLAGATLTGGSAAPAAITGATTAPVEVRTQVVHRTERVVRHVRRVHHRRPAPATAPARVPVSQPAAAAPAVTHASTPARPARPRVVTRTSGASTRGEGEDHGRDDGHESEGGDD
jgi:hypothetical protein